MNGNDSGNGGKVATVVQLPHWLPLDEAARVLGIAARTVRHRALQGKIERRRAGRRTLYQVNGTAALPLAGVRDDSGNNGNGGKAAIAIAGVAAMKAPVAEEGGVQLVGFVERLVDRVVRLERENAEAIQVGHFLADERDQLHQELGEASEVLVRANNDVRRLHGALETMAEAVAQLATSPLARPLRQRLWAILAI